MDLWGLNHGLSLVLLVTAVVRCIPAPSVNYLLAYRDHLRLNQVLSGHYRRYHSFNTLRRLQSGPRPENYLAWCGSKSQFSLARAHAVVHYKLLLK